MTQKGCINCISMGIEKEFVLHENWLKVVKVNLEVKWMMGGAEPDFRTISDFRKKIT